MSLTCTVLVLPVITATEVVVICISTSLVLVDIVNLGVVGVIVTESLVAAIAGIYIQTHTTHMISYLYHLATYFKYMRTEWIRVPFLGMGLLGLI